MKKRTVKALKQITNPKPKWSKRDIERVLEWSRKICDTLGIK